MSQPQPSPPPASAELQVVKKTKLSVNRRKILDEDLYLDNMGKIIERDFFPDLEKLKAQNEYLDAVSENNVDKLRQLYSKYSSGRRPPPERYASPATFETPSIPRNKDDENLDSTRKHDQKLDEENIEEKKEKATQSLDQYLTSHTSEDNESFREIQEESFKKHQIKHNWLYKNEEEFNIKNRLALPSIEEQAAGHDRSLTVDTWNYKNNNFIMYVPDGVELTDEEKLELAAKRQEIVHVNTRIGVNLFNEERNKETIHELALNQAKTMEGKIGVDGKIMTCGQTPKVNGYSFVKTPSPAPGVNETPLMTWGEIEGTPFRLDGGDTPRPSTGPAFRIPEVPKRERLALALADKVNEQHRDKKRKAIEAAKSNLSVISPRHQMSTLDRLNEMSPAAQRLASSSLGKRLGTDSALRSSYSPSPKRTPSRTPTRTPGSSPLVRVRRPTPINLTDNLLKLPVRPKASDFF